MATVTPERTEVGEGEPCVVLRGVGWKGYSAVLKLRGERSYPRMVYLDGDLWLMSPSRIHEWEKKRLGMLVMVVVEELDIPCKMSGSTTFRRKKKRGGVEPDESFYLANSHRVLGRRELHLRHDPPPDLVVEAVHTHDADEAIEVYRRLGVPEVWVAEEKGVTFLVLSDRGRYAPAESSASFPFLKAAEVAEWVMKDQDADDLDWVKALRRWVRETLVPRREAMGN
jgi:Uma2 family endonuclease